ncbi:CapA family protein [Anthropogastromicrobium aceti]|jgi:poly-gamma-glutamate capsule biosynthesis protein CapA/YwtB (metallophosphatase superfamily)|uniref:CapA family protein n=1 Tax=Anthropogastromicrobium aceti TaxID=2981768 RepID=A0AAE3E1X5_9FIRM|nr:CapA family protein [Anthropogastromicrobium aceti]MCC2220056.1 CapA family protein [Anthropogastromicrobium aceti]
MSKSRKKKKDSFKIIYMILGIEMLVTVAVIGYFGYHYGSILLAGFKSAKASISSQTPVQDPGYPIDVDGQAPTNQVQADTEVVTEEVFKPTSAKLVAVGDNLMHRSCTLSAKNADGTYDFTKHFANMADIFKAADLAVISQDTVLGGIELGATSTETGIFNTAVELADGMADAGINVVLAANNHIMDEGSAGLNTMMSYFSTKYPNITLLGVNNSREAKDEPVYVETNNIKIAMINYSYGSNQTADLDASPYLLNQYDEDWLSDILKQAREEADFIIAFPFWGEQNSMDYTQEQERQAQFLADNGVDLIIGSYPHVVEPVKWITAENGDRTLVYYSLGNFQSIQNTVENMLGGQANVTISKEEDGTHISDYSLDFVVTHYEQRESSEYYDIVTTYPLADYTSDLAARHGMSVSGNEEFNLASLQGLSSQILSKCDLDESKEQDASKDELTDESTDESTDGEN